MSHWTLWNVGCVSRSCICETPSSQILPAKFSVIAFKGIKVFFLRCSSFPHSSICPRSSHPSQWCQSGRAGASVWETWWPGRRCQQSEVPPSPTSHSSSPRPLFFKLSYSFLISSLLYFLHLLANPVVLAKFPSLVCCKVFSPTAFCCPSFPKYLLVILHNREQRPNIQVLLEKCQMTAAKIFPKRERDMANQANAP